MSKQETSILKKIIKKIDPNLNCGLLFGNGFNMYLLDKFEKETNQGGLNNGCQFKTEEGDKLRATCYNPINIIIYFDKKIKSFNFLNEINSIVKKLFRIYSSFVNGFLVNNSSYWSSLNARLKRKFIAINEGNSFEKSILEYIKFGTNNNKNSRIWENKNEFKIGKFNKSKFDKELHIWVANISGFFDRISILIKEQNLMSKYSLFNYYFDRKYFNVDNNEKILTTNFHNSVSYLEIHNLVYLHGSYHQLKNNEIETLSLEGLVSDKKSNEKSKKLNEKVEKNLEYFRKLNIEVLDIIGWSPSNDLHIISAILENKNIKELNYFCYKEQGLFEIQENMIDKLKQTENKITVNIIPLFDEENKDLFHHYLKTNELSNIINMDNIYSIK